MDDLEEIRILVIRLHNLAKDDKLYTVDLPYLRYHDIKAECQQFNLCSIPTMHKIGRKELNLKIETLENTPRGFDKVKDVVDGCVFYVSQLQLSDSEHSSLFDHSPSKKQFSPFQWYYIVDLSVNHFARLWCESRSVATYLKVKYTGR